jgi:hypothetical protein
MLLLESSMELGILGEQNRFTTLIKASICAQQQKEENTVKCNLTLGLSSLIFILDMLIKDLFMASPFSPLKQS